LALPAKQYEIAESMFRGDAFAEPGNLWPRKLHDEQPTRKIVIIVRSQIQELKQMSMVIFKKAKSGIILLFFRLCGLLLALPAKQAYNAKILIPKF
jgi:hypothetical protein